MKRVFVAVSGVCLLLASCVSRGSAERLESQRDSLARVVDAKDSLIGAVFEDINSISGNLARIKAREHLIAVTDNGEGGRRPVEEINNDIAAIDRLLQENREKISSLQRSAALLRKANLRIDGLEKMIAGLGEQLDEKRAEIVRLRENLERMGVEVKTLTDRVAERSAEVATLSEAKTELEDRLNRVYYIVGPEKELVEAQIVEKKGFIGRMLAVSEENSFDGFLQADRRQLTEIPVGHRRATVVTSHPGGSYELVTDADRVVTKLLITDPEHFWESSKMLVISYR